MEPRVIPRITLDDSAELLVVLVATAGVSVEVEVALVSDRTDVVEKIEVEVGSVVVVDSSVEVVLDEVNVVVVEEAEELVVVSSFKSFCSGTERNWVELSQVFSPVLNMSIGWSLLPPVKTTSPSFPCAIA